MSLHGRRALCAAASAASAVTAVGRCDESASASASAARATPAALQEVERLCAAAADFDEWRLAAGAAAATRPEYASSCALPCARWSELPLLRVRPYNHDTSIFEFGLAPLGAPQLPT